MLRQASVRMQSRVLTAAQITELAGVSPTRYVNVGDPVSSRLSDGPRHKVTTWSRSSMESSDVLADHVVALQPILNVVGRVRQADPELYVDIVIMLEAASLGAMIDVEAAHVALLARAGCGIVIDAYEADSPERVQAGEGRVEFR
ncbi:MAG: hypothetical protein CVT62_07325 [Actinobacteria bacterium HGW-Actinobacteria-2]|nr:MAG: hypothetical protein CVT62_07325 [Actinobacteria bacterium HGW-Actinobacteria-2]